MSASKASKSFQDQTKNLQTFFETALRSIQLGDDQLKNQNYEELLDSLETINDAIRNPDSFGTMSLRFDAGVGMIITNLSSQAHVRIGVLPFLLQKKRYIMERLRAEKATIEIGTLKEELEQVTETPLKETLSQKIERLEEDANHWRKKAEEVPKVNLVEKLEYELQKNSMEIDRFERRSRVWQNWLARESVATFIGAFLVFAITIAFLIAAVTGYELPSVVVNAYFVILGYFFGQGAVNNLRENSTSQTSNDE